MDPNFSISYSRDRTKINLLCNNAGYGCHFLAEQEPQRNGGGQTSVVDPNPKILAGSESKSDTDSDPDTVRYGTG
jgi:hypothetical protein